jgi:DNA-directed RNA polymerase specialized sigma subunit
MDNSNSINVKERVKGTTCFSEHEKRSLTCEKDKCRMWIEDKKSLNCCIIKAKEPHTLQDIGDLIGVTRMRVCQLEKSILQKVEAQKNVVELNPYV